MDLDGDNHVTNSSSEETDHLEWNNKKIKGGKSSFQPTCPTVSYRDSLLYPSSGDWEANPLDTHDTLDSDDDSDAEDSCPIILLLKEEKAWTREP